MAINIIIAITFITTITIIKTLKCCYHHQNLRIFAPERIRII
jgi:hypothetical protein